MRTLVFVVAVLASTGGFATDVSRTSEASLDAPGTLDRARVANETAQARYYAIQADRQATQHDRAELPAWLQTVLGGLLAIGGGMLTTWVGNRVAEDKARREQRRSYDRERSQLRLALADLRTALVPIVADGPLPAFLREDLLYHRLQRPTVPDRSDAFYRKYDLVDTIYRFCALLGWIELYRNDPSFLRGTEAENRRLESCFAGIRSALAADFADEKHVAGATRDGFVLEDDQRAIGETMLARRRSDVVIGYAAFCERLFRDPRPEDPTAAADPTSQNWWIWNATRFFVELGAAGTETDFRRTRIRRVVACVDEAIAATESIAR